jgi:hypothetical protein
VRLQGETTKRQEEATRGREKGVLQQLKTTDTVFFGLRHNLWIRGPVLGKRLDAPTSHL